MYNIKNCITVICWGCVGYYIIN